MSALWTFIHPWSSHFLRFSTTPWIAYIESDIIVRASPFGVISKAFTIAIKSPLILYAEDTCSSSCPGSVTLQACTICVQGLLFLGVCVFSSYRFVLSLAVFE